MAYVKLFGPTVIKTRPPFFLPRSVSLLLCIFEYYISNYWEFFFIFVASRHRQAIKYLTVGRVPPFDRTCYNGRLH